MNSKKIPFLNHLKPIENTVNGVNAITELSGLSAVISDTGKAKENSFRLRMQEKEELNAYLKKLVDKHSEKLTEIGATNSKFISIIAHDLRSPVISILYALEIVKKSLNNHTKSEIENSIEMASICANNTLNLLDDLLTWTISQNKESSFNPVKIKLCELVGDEIESINALAKRKQITLMHSITPDLNVTADLQMVKTILRNLIGNAIKYTNTGGEITISASAGKQWVEIAVNDNGIGISSRARQKLFKIDEFHSSAGTHDEKGTGFGLLFCKEFVEMHGGNIRIESEPDKGSKFTFTLPHYI
jgi:signal transduction histidine kinase